MTSKRQKTEKKSESSATFQSTVATINGEAERASTGKRPTFAWNRLALVMGLRIAEFVRPLDLLHLRQVPTTRAIFVHPSNLRFPRLVFAKGELSTFWSYFGSSEERQIGATAFLRSIGTVTTSLCAEDLELFNLLREEKGERKRTFPELTRVELSNTRMLSGFWDQLLSGCPQLTSFRLDRVSFDALDHARWTNAETAGRPWTSIELNECNERIMRPAELLQFANPALEVVEMTKGRATFYETPYTWTLDHARQLTSAAPNLRRFVVYFRLDGSQDDAIVRQMLQLPKLETWIINGGIGVQHSDTIHALYAALNNLDTLPPHEHKIFLTEPVESHPPTTAFRSKTPLRSIRFTHDLIDRAFGLNIRHNFFKSWTPRQLYDVLQSSTAWETVIVHEDAESEDRFDPDTLTHLLKQEQLHTIEIRRPVRPTAAHLLALARRPALKWVVFGRIEHISQAAAEYDAKDVDGKTMLAVMETARRGWDNYWSFVYLYFGVLSQLTVKDVEAIDDVLAQGSAIAEFIVSGDTGMQLQRCARTLEKQWRNDLALRLVTASPEVWASADEFAESPSGGTKTPYVVRMRSRAW